MRDRLNRHFVRTNLVWVIGVAAGVLLGGAVAYELTASAPQAIAAVSR